MSGLTCKWCKDDLFSPDEERRGRCKMCASYEDAMFRQWLAAWSAIGWMAEKDLRVKQLAIDAYECKQIQFNQRRALRNRPNRRPR